MDSSIDYISSDSLLIDIEHHFRVSAGPGAGKTHWLVKHLRNVLQRSSRLHKTRKIACITYTNVAVEAILQSLGSASAQTEISTIHSFLYAHVVRPYAAFIDQIYGLNLARLDGHDDYIRSNYKFLNEWKERTGQRRIHSDHEIVYAMEKARWHFDGGDLVIGPDYPIKVDRYPLRKDSYFEFKKMSWAKGDLHHEDVLFFSYKLIKDYPFIVNILRAKFPYFFIDEFQDTNPIQAEILGLIGASETIVGVIGDVAQSIYGFQGADPVRFATFGLPGMVDYVIKDNRRSTQRIVRVLNSIRSDIEQVPLRNEEGALPVLIVGDMVDSHRRAVTLSGTMDIFSLSRDNITSNAMKRELSGVAFRDDLLKKIVLSDSNEKRRKCIVACVKGIELARESRFEDALRELARIVPRDLNDVDRKRESLRMLRALISQYDCFHHGSLHDFYLAVKMVVASDLSGFKKGAAKTFYEDHGYQDLAVCVKIVEDKSRHRTIHKAKGDEFENVLLILKEEAALSFLLTPDLLPAGNVAEEQRVYYVAASRARSRLFISVPSLTAINESKLMDRFSIVRLDMSLKPL